MHLCACMSTRSWFSAALAAWYRGNQRPLPWRGSRDPYPIWLSEVILQQTRVDQGSAYWQRFVQRWPTVEALAEAHTADVLKEWQGLGYYSRARNLHTAAKQVVQDHGGFFPADIDALRGLKGVGDYTAAAIGSIAFNLPEAVVDGNVYRVLARCFGIDLPIDSTPGRKTFKALAMELIDPAAPGDHNQAVMELGAIICTPQRPTCTSCPVADHCIARATGTIDRLPVKQGKNKVRDRWFNYLVVERAGKLAHVQRAHKDIWLGLHEPPMLEAAGKLDAPELEQLLHAHFGPGWQAAGSWQAPPRQLSHQRIHATFWSVHLHGNAAAPVDWLWADPQEWERLPVHRTIEQWWQQRAK